MDILRHWEQDLNKSSKWFMPALGLLLLMYVPQFVPRTSLDNFISSHKLAQLIILLGLAWAIAKDFLTGLAIVVVALVIYYVSIPLYTDYIGYVEDLYPKMLDMNNHQVGSVTVNPVNPTPVPQGPAPNESPMTSMVGDTVTVNQSQPSPYAPVTHDENTMQVVQKSGGCSL